VKVLSPAVTCLLTSHMKPTLAEAIDSVLAQTRRDFELVIADSGQWIGRGDDISLALAACHDIYSRHPLIRWITTGEAPGLPSRKCPVSWVTNEAIRAGLIRGRYMCTFYDDDLYEPHFMAEMAGYLDARPDCQAAWCSENRVSLHPDGTQTHSFVIPASVPKSGPSFDCQIDGAQVMWRTSLLDKIGDPWLDEDPADSSCRHSDGLFLNKLGTAAGTVENVPVADPLVTHRHTPWSAYSPCAG
jgi:hypothetical protein